MSISVIIPTLNETANIAAAVCSSRSTATEEIIVVDGGSRDDTVKVAHSLGATILTSGPGRAWQMNLGARAAKGNVLLFLHADTILPKGFDRHIMEILQQPTVAAGAFLLSIEGPLRGYRIIEHLANWRSRRLRMPYGDQGIFLRATTFRAVGGFPEISIMEDFAFIRRVAKLGSIAIATVPVATSARRWQTVGLFKATIINQVVIAAYLLGISPARISRLYRSKEE